MSSAPGWLAAALDRADKLSGCRSLASVGKEHMHFRPPDEQNAHKVKQLQLCCAEPLLQTVPDAHWPVQVTCGVQAESVASVTESIQAALEEAGVHAQLILSGKGDWRFLDIVSTGAGKLSALE